MPIWIDEHNAEDYLRQHGHLLSGSRVQVHVLAGGVSNQVLYVHVTPPPDPSAGQGLQQDFVLKQARAQLRTKDPWFCTVERIWREVDFLKACEPLVAQTYWNEGDSPGSLPNRAGTPPVCVRLPKILFEDRENYLCGMSAASPTHHVWKADLLAGKFQPAISASCGTLLGRLHARSWLHARLREQFQDRQIFRELRAQPYYACTARARPEAALLFERLVESLEQHALSLVHADFSPKNLLVEDGGLMMVDFETGHFGDPAFDLGFFGSHLLLKAAYHAPRVGPVVELALAFMERYQAELRTRVDENTLHELIGRGLAHLAGCGWARLDGTSKIEYLPDEHRRSAVRALCQAWLQQVPRDWALAWEEAGRHLGQIQA